MTRMSVEIEGSADDVIRVIRRLGGAGQRATAGGDGGSMEAPTGSGEEGTSVVGAGMADVSEEAAPGAWTEALASEFLSRLPAAARRMALQVWRAGAAGIHRSALGQRAELTPGELRSALMQMGRALGRFQRERGMTLSRPVAANRPLQSYFVDEDFAAAANAQMFGDGMGVRLVDGAGRP